MRAGGKRGLTLPAGWCDRPGPAFVVEGPTDAAALAAAGLCAVGRPSKDGGGKLLGELFTGWPKDRDIVIVGENDPPAPDGRLDGRDAAVRLAQKLALGLGRPIRWTLPPAGAKDVRGWLTHPDRGSTSWPDRGTELSAKLLAAAGLVNPPGGEPPDAVPNPGGSSRPHRAEIVLGTDEHRVNDEAVAALAREHDIYQRGGMLVHLIEQDADSGDGEGVRREAGAPVVRELLKPLLRERLTRVARWVRLEQRGGEEVVVPAHPSGWAVDAVHARGSWPRVRRLEAVVTHPVLLPNGTILTADGYHKGTRLLVRLPRDLAIEVSDRPTRAAVTAAVGELLDPLTDFPFETPAHRAAIVAGLLTPLAYFAFDGPAPLFLIDKNVRGAGAGLLADVVAIILSGRRFPVMTYTSDREELRKRITTAAVEGERLILLDNLAGAVGNDVLAAALTSTSWKDRLLGGNRMFNGPLYVTWFATGNNVQLQADTSRRVCHARMESADERPELRAGFKYRALRAHVRANRGRLLSAALTILRGWAVAGKPTHGLKAWGSYEPWSDVVREAVVFAGLPDPGDTRMALQTAADRDAGAMGVILDGLEKLDANGRGVTAADIIAKLKNVDDGSPEWVAEMRSAVEELCGKLDARPLSMKLRHFKRRNFHGKMLDAAGADRQHGNRWTVMTAAKMRPEPPPAAPRSPEPRAGGAGDVGDDPAPAEPAQAMMRHSDIKLTMGVYTDPALLDVRDALDRLPAFGPSEPMNAPLPSPQPPTKPPPTPGTEGQNVASGGKLGGSTRFGSLSGEPCENAGTVNKKPHVTTPVIAGADSEQQYAKNSPRRSQLDSGFFERGTLQVNRLRRAAVIALFPWNDFSDAKPKLEQAPKERRDPLKLARYYQSLLDTGKFESRAALARYLGVSRARVTQVLSRLRTCQ